MIGGELNGLGVCRSLAMSGISVWVVDSKRSNPALWSRYAHPVLTDSLHGPGFIGFLRDLQSRIGEPPFLVVTDELALLAISEHRKELEGLYCFRLPAHETVLMLHDVHGWPVRLGARPIPPRSVVVDGFWRRDDPLPARVHYSRNVAHAVALHLPPWLAELRRNPGRADHRSSSKS